MDLSLELAELLGLLCAEGSHTIGYSNYIEKKTGRKIKNKKSERIEFYNKDKNLLKHFQKLISKEFYYIPNITKNNKINLCRNKIIQNLTSYTEFGWNKWSVPRHIQKGTKKIKHQFIRGYFDGDGTAKGPIRFFSSNRKALEQISDILSGLGYKHTFLGPYKKQGKADSYVIQLSRKEKETFLNKTKPISKQP